MGGRHAEETKRRYWESPRSEQTKTPQKDVQGNCRRESQWKWKGLEWNKQGWPTIERGGHVWLLPYSLLQRATGTDDCGDDNGDDADDDYVLWQTDDTSIQSTAFLISFKLLFWHWKYLFKIQFPTTETSISHSVYWQTCWLDDRGIVFRLLAETEQFLLFVASTPAMWPTNLLFKVSGGPFPCMQGCFHVGSFCGKLCRL
jgi:hypothetical protein